MIAAARVYLKRFAALGTDFATKYREDPFFRTETNIIGLVALFAAGLLLMLVGTRLYLLDQIRSTILPIFDAGMSRALTKDQVDILFSQQITQLSTYHLLAITALTALFTLLIGVIIGRVALSPTRGALSSQKQFIGNIAHELRTPLAVIKTNTEVALLQNLADHSTKKMLESNLEELNRISEIINNLLSLSSAVRPERIEFENVDMGLIVDGVMKKLSGIVKQKRLDVTTRKSDFRLVWGNPAGLEQIATNLIKNAINYTPMGGRIDVTLEPDYQNHIELMVQDSGQGIARKDLFHIFEPFYRADTSRTRGADGGSGLGLTIANELVKLHQGKIVIRSAVGRGTTASVFLPSGRRIEKSKTFEGMHEIASDFSRKG